MLSGAGEETCGNTRCVHHEASKAIPMPPLRTVELPFSYEEGGEMRSALVKTVLCDRCIKKLMWKRNKEREASTGINAEKTGSQMQLAEREDRRKDNTERKVHDRSDDELKKEYILSDVYGRRRRHSRSRSPRRKKHRE